MGSCCRAIGGTPESRHFGQVAVRYGLHEALDRASCGMYRLNRRRSAATGQQDKHRPTPSLLDHKSLTDRMLASELNRHGSAEQ
jgi:hypothetical protein